MPHLSPQTLRLAEQRAILRATAGNLRDHLIYSLALGTGLRLAEIVGLNVGDVYLPKGTPRTRIRLRPEIAKGGRCSDVFLPDSLVRKFLRFRRHKRRIGHGLKPSDPLFCSQGGRRRISPRRVQFAFRTWQVKAGPLPAPCPAPYSGHERLPGLKRFIPSPAVCEACESADDDRLHTPERSGTLARDQTAPLLSLTSELEV